MVRHGPVSMATTIVTAALLSGAWTVHAAGLGLPGATAGDVAPAPARPSASAPVSSPVQPEVTVPAAAYDPPVSVSARLAPAAAMSPERARAIVASAVATAIPSVALAAYQRAAVVIDEADPTCHLDWELLAAIGRVESDHGSAHGHALSSEGVATPAIVGRRLDGHGDALVPDTDGGRYDGDRRFDHAVGPLQLIPSTWSMVSVDADGDGRRAVGPLQLIPSTWSMVSVDADGDGRRDPQDVDDASLAAGVYLCAGAGDLATIAGRRAAVLRYNHSPSYVSTVLRTASAYRSSSSLVGVLSASQVASVSARALVTLSDLGSDPADDTHPVSTRHGKHRHRHQGKHGQQDHHGSAVGVTSPAHVTSIASGPAPGAAPTPAPTPTPTPTAAPGSDPTPTDAPTEAPSDVPAADPARVEGGAASGEVAPDPSAEAVATAAGAAVG